MSLRKQTISGVKWTTVSTLIIALSGILKIAVLARFLAAEDFGLMAIVTLVLGFMTLFMDMGLTTAILHKQTISANEYASLYWINIIISLLLYGIISAASPLIAFFYEEPELNQLIPLASVCIILSALGIQFKTIKEKALNFKFIALADGSGAILGLIIGIVLAVKGFGVYALVYAAIAQYSLANIIYFSNGMRQRHKLMHFRFSETKPFLKIGIYQVGSQIINYFNRDLDILLIGKFFGSDILGGYSLAKELVKKPMMILNPIITKVAGPVLALIQHNKPQLQAKFLQFISLISTANFTVYAAIALLAYPIVYVLYGVDFLNIVGLVQILSICMYLRAIGNPISGLVIATGRTDIEFRWNLFVLFIMPIVIYYSALSGHIQTVAWSLSAITFVLLFLGWRFLVRPMCGAPLKMYFHHIIPNWRKIISVLQEERHRSKA